MTAAQKSKFDSARYKFYYSNIAYVKMSSWYSTILMSVFALLPLLGGTWILGLFFVASSDSEVLAWIFTIMNSLQVSM